MFVLHVRKWNTAKYAILNTVDRKENKDDEG